MKFNWSKCKFGVKEVKYVGHIFTSGGIKPDDSKVKAIKEMPVPKNAQDLRRFLGLTTYLGKFITNLAERTVNLRAFCKKGVPWNWTKVQQDDYDKLKEIISKDVILKYYDPSEPVTLSVYS